MNTRPRPASLAQVPTAGTPLTPAQTAFFKAFGYLVLRGFFSSEDRRTIDREFSAALARQYAHRPFDGSARQWTTMMDEDTPFFAGLLEDPRLVGMVGQLMPEPMLGITVDANRYVGDTWWHSDSRSPLQHGIKFAFYLQPVGARTGALRVIPGSHLLPLPNDAFAAAVGALGAIDAVPAQALESEPGDLVVFDLRLWHASCGGGVDRRMCTAVYYNDPRTADEQRFLHAQSVANVEQVVEFFQPASRHLYSRSWLANPGRSPLRAAWIARLRELGVLDIPGTVEGEATARTARPV
jgi:hypothetical protein